MPAIINAGLWMLGNQTTKDMHCAYYTIKDLGTLEYGKVNIMQKTYHFSLSFFPWNMYIDKIYLINAK